MKKLLLIVNPYAGQEKAKKNLADIIGIYNRAGYQVIAYMTEKPGDGEKALVECEEDLELVVCSGGDGTFNETMAGVIKRGTDLPIGYIPAGSTNDFASSLHLSSNLLEAAQDILKTSPVRIDAGRFNERLFAYIASFGLFTRTSYNTPQELKNVLGHVAYILSGIQELSQLKPYHLKFELPDGTEIEDDFIYGSITNSTSVGGVLKLTDDMVDLKDGEFELMLIREPKDLFELNECIIALSQRTFNCSMLTFTKLSSVKITASADMDWTLDGEFEQGCEQIEVKCMKEAISVFCNYGMSEDVQDEAN